MGGMSRALNDPTGEAILLEWERRVKDALCWGELVTHLPGAQVYAKRSSGSGEARVRAILTSGVLTDAAARSASKLLS